uniref:Uncharacterized protein n=1 Tax=Plectus sambesii TaxID=2011161 RepID=A0A914VQF9_9BILA
MPNYDMLSMNLSSAPPPCRHRNHVHSTDWREMLNIVRFRRRAASLSHPRPRLPTVSHTVHGRSRLTSITSNHVSLSGVWLALTDGCKSRLLSLGLIACVRLMALFGGGFH